MAYLCIHSPSCTVIKKKPWYIVIIHWLDTMNILHIKISDSIVNFIAKSIVTITDPTCLRQFCVVFWAIYYKFFHLFFFSTYITGMILMIINNLPRIVILLPSSLIHKCWYSNSRALFFSSYFFKLHSLHDFASLTFLFLFKFWFFLKDLTKGTCLTHTFSCLLIFSKHFNNGQKADRFLMMLIFICVDIRFTWRIHCLSL